MLLCAVAVFLTSSAHASSLSRSYALKPIRQRRAQFRACYEQALKRDPRLEGRLSTRFTIDRRGVVVVARTTHDELGDPVLASCVRRLFLNMRYVPAPSSRITITYPVQFVLKRPAR